ncbi:MAG: hypothetical protein AB1324_03365 [Candidatus Micrarchaeota archaeon]
MPHTLQFHPPVRGKGGPLLRLRVKEPLEELGRELSSKIIEGPETPYRKSRDVENLLDSVTFGFRQADPLLMLSLGLDSGVKGAPFELARGHIHSASEPMRPDVLLGHSSAEGGATVRIAIMEELSVLAATMLRELGKDCYLSVIHSADGANLSGIALISDGTIESFVIRGNHPTVSGLTIFDDREALNVLLLLRAHNGLRKLFLEVKDKSGLSSSDMERYKRLMADFAVGAESAHHLVRIVEEVYVAFSSRFPDALSQKC